MILIRNLQRHEFHLVDISPWPFFTSGAVLSLTLSLAQWFHGWADKYFTGYHSVS